MIKIRNTNMAQKSRVSPSSIEANLTNAQRLLPKNDFVKEVSEAEVYTQERLDCNKIRLVVTLNPMCTNVLFNRVTEVVKNEGADSCLCLNYGGMQGDHGNDIASCLQDADFQKKWQDIEGKNVSYFNREDNNLERGASTLTRDTSLTADGLGIDYKCGIDIFNNHLLRSKTFKIVCDTLTAGGKKREYNTIFDMMREGDGKQVRGYTLSGNTLIDLHLYLKDEIMDFDECVDTNLEEDEGWFGFTNKGKILTYTAENNDGDASLPINRVINNRPACSFVDLSPGRDLWYFTPKFNSHRNKFEYNWNYCLTYPQTSTTEISFIRQKSNSLKVYYFDDSVSVGGTSACKIVSYCKHGLQVGDSINLYINGAKSNEDDTIIRALSVLRVEDDYTFYVKYTSSNWIYDTNFIIWENSFGFDNQITNVLNSSEDLTTKREYEWDTRTRKTIKMTETDEKGEVSQTIFPVFIDDNGKYKCNISSTCNDVSYKQVYNAEEVQYYVRIFAKIPNWKFAETLPTITTSDDEMLTMIDKYSAKEYDFESSLSKLAFSKNAYGDDISQIVFNDDIDLSGLTDNLGRPVTEIFLTLLKNNAGYRQWYGKKGAAVSTKSNNVEYSHVFGKLSCAFELTPQSVMDGDHQNIVQTNNVSSEYCCNGLDIANIIDDNRPAEIDSDEIEFNSLYDENGELLYDGDNKFYGDLCMYSPANVAEVVIDDVWYRFNTAQRELTPSDTSYDYLSFVTYDEILFDDYDTQTFKGTTEKINNACTSQEGYKYKPHYRIPIKSFSRDLLTADPLIVDIENIEYDTAKDIYHIQTLEENYNELNDSFIIFNSYRNEYYIGIVTEILDSLNFKCTLRNDVPGNVHMFDEDVTYKFIRKQETIPDNARLLRDGSLLYAWREIYQNGFDSYSINENYPFTNGALYIEKDFRVFVKRQDPDKLAKYATLTNVATINDVDSVRTDYSEVDEYFNEMNCFTEVIDKYSLQNMVQNNKIFG